jgi:hypothetical protein
MSDDIDKIVDECMTEQNDASSVMKERLIGVVAGGNSKEYLGKSISSSEIENLDDKEITKLYARYEAYLGGQITRTLKKHMICAYTKGVELICPSVNMKLFEMNKMNDELNDGPFIDIALTSLTCKLYHQYGHLLAPIEAALITSNHLKSEPKLVEQLSSDLLTTS